VTCREFAEFIADYLAGELPAPQREAFDRHLSGCTNCARYLEGYRQTLALSKAAFDDAGDDVVSGFPVRRSAIREDGSGTDPELPSDIPEDLANAILRARRTTDVN
jgi:anti-sigma factor RsiW